MLRLCRWRRLAGSRGTFKACRRVVMSDTNIQPYYPLERQCAVHLFGYDYVISVRSL